MLRSILGKLIVVSMALVLVTGFSTTQILANCKDECHEMKGKQKNA